MTHAFWHGECVIVAGNLRKKLSITRHDGFGLKIKLDHVVVIVSEIRAMYSKLESPNIYR